MTALMTLLTATSFLIATMWLSINKPKKSDKDREAINKAEERKQRRQERNKHIAEAEKKRADAKAIEQMWAKVIANRKNRNY